MTLTVNAVEIENLTKTFISIRRRAIVIPVEKKRVEALKGISLDIPHGEVYGLLGPNGAGKTTLIKCLATLVLPTSGTARINGYDILQESTYARASMGVCQGNERSIYWKLTARENMIFFAKLYRMPHNEAKERADELLGRMELLEKADEKTEKLSHGMRMKIVFALTCVVLLAKQGWMIIEFISSALMLVAPMAYPIAVLHPMLQYVSVASPLTWSVESFRGFLMYGFAAPGIMTAVGALLILDVIYIVVGILMFRYTERYVRKKGALSQF